MSTDTLTPAILQHISTGAYPDSEALSSTSLRPAALTTLLSSLQTEQSSAKASIRSLSRASAPDIDTWISRAKTLQADILRSRATAREILAEAEVGRELREGVREGGEKVKFLEREGGFYGALGGVLEQVGFCWGGLGEVGEKVERGEWERGAERLEVVEMSVGGLRGVEGSRAVGLLEKRVGEVREGLVEGVRRGWEGCVRVDTGGRRVWIGEGEEVRSLVKVAAGLDLLPRLLQKFARDVERVVLRPRLSGGEGGGRGSIVVAGDEMRFDPAAQGDRSTSVFDDLKEVVDFLAGHLPEDVARQLSETLVPAMTSRLEEHYLEPSVPLEMSQMGAFENTLNSVLDLAQHLETLKWHGAPALREWVKSAPRTWLTKRRETVLGDVRNLVFTGLHERKTVERVETQVVSKGDALAGNGEGGEDDWDTAWDEPEEETAPAAHEKPGAQSQNPPDEDDDASAWDTDDLAEDEKKGDDGAEDAWGWGDEDGSQKTSSPVMTRKNPTQADERNEAAKPSEREMTLRETYTVTAIPDTILSTIQQVISDAQTLSGPDFSTSPIAPAATGLYTLPTLALAIYRATAPTAYTSLPTGAMLIYNDASRLSSQLLAWQASRPPATRLRLETDATALEQFAKRAYSAEMDSQRTILRDLLDGAQGFANCTVAPFKAECESAVEQTIDRLREVHNQWHPILAQSALLQSLGSLLASVTSKMIVDIEDLGDISEADSQQLKRLCERVMTLKDLFGASRDMTFVYCPNWLKFQYLAEILESSLADIRFLWEEGELSLEFEAEEVVELVEALFAESDLRRKAVAGIRRGGRG